MIRAVAAATPAERDFWARAIGRGDQRAGDLDEALRLMARHGALVAANAAAEAHAARARAALAALPDGPLHGQLDALVGFVVARAA